MTLAEDLDVLFELLDLEDEVLEMRGPVYDQFHRRIDEDDWDDMPEQILVDGPAGGGKTLGLAYWIDRVARTFPGTPILILREKRVDLTTSWCKTYEDEVLDDDDETAKYVKASGPSAASRQTYYYPPCPQTGRQSTITLGALSQWERFRSQQFLIIWIVEGSEASRENTMGVIRALRPSRLNRKARRQARQMERLQGSGAFPKRLLLIDTNPDGEEHHLNVWANEGVFHRETVYVHHNPLFWDAESDKATEEGAAYIARLERGTDGHVRDRLLKGLWTSALGAMFPMWNPRIHLFDYRMEWPQAGVTVLHFLGGHPMLGESVELVDVIGSIDWGTRNPGALLIWGIDRDARMYLLAECYHREKDLGWWCERAVEAYVKYRPTRIIADVDKPNDIIRMNQVLHEKFETFLGKYQVPRSSEERAKGRLGRDGSEARIVRPCVKNTASAKHQTNWQLLRWALGTHEDGIPRMFASMSTLMHAPEAALVGEQKATCFRQEVTRAKWAAYDPGKAKGKAKDDIDGKCADHALTAAAYAVSELFGRGLEKDAVQDLAKRARPGSWDAMLEAGQEQNDDAGDGWQEPLEGYGLDASEWD